MENTPSYVLHIPRVSKKQSHPHLGLPLMEGEDNSELGRQVCVKFIWKARALQLKELSLPARVIAINHILVATLWYFVFAWAPSKQDFKKLQTIILNFLWSQTMDKPECSLKVAWAHLIQPKKQGGLGLMDPRLKATALHGQWTIKALSPSVYPWDGYITGRLKTLRAVSHGGQSSVHVFAAKPDMQDWTGSPLWRAIWSGWEKLKKLVRFKIPRDREHTAALFLQGHGQAWNQETESKLKGSRRIFAASSKGLVKLVDLWKWEAQRWHTEQELTDFFSIPSSCAKMLPDARTSGLREEVRTALNNPVEVNVNSWFTECSIFESAPAKAQVSSKAYLTRRQEDTCWNVDVYKVTKLSKSGSAHLQLVREKCNMQMGEMTPILVLRALKKARWVNWDENLADLRDLPDDLVWFEGCALSQLDVQPQ